MSKEIFVVWDIETQHKSSKPTFPPHIEKDIERRVRISTHADPSLSKENAFDIAVLTNPHWSNLLAISYQVVQRDGTKLFPGKTLMVTDTSEKTELHTLSKFMKACASLEEDYRRVTYVGYNSIWFDAWYLHQKCIIHNKKDFSDKPLGLFTFNRFQTRPHFDLMQSLSNWDAKHFMKLSTLCTSLNIEMKHKLLATQGDSFELLEYVNKREFEKVAQYSQEDIRLTTEVFTRVVDFYLD